MSKQLFESVNAKIDENDVVGASRAGGIIERKRKPGDKYAPVVDEASQPRTTAEFEAAIRRPAASSFGGFQAIK